MIHLNVPAHPEPLTVDQATAARLAGVSAKTLERLAIAGEPVGRIKVGRRVLYVRCELEKWIVAQLAPKH